MSNQIGNCNGCDMTLWDDGRAGRHGHIAHNGELCQDCIEDGKIRDLESAVESLANDIRLAIAELESPIPAIAWTEIGDSIVTERLTAAARMRQILTSHGLEVAPTPDEVRKAVEDRCAR